MWTGIAGAAATCGTLGACRKVAVWAGGVRLRRSLLLGVTVVR